MPERRNIEEIIAGINKRGAGASGRRLERQGGFVAPRARLPRRLSGELYSSEHYNIFGIQLPKWPTRIAAMGTGAIIAYMNNWSGYAEQIYHNATKLIGGN